jgi:hypothetical protein
VKKQTNRVEDEVTLSCLEDNIHILYRLNAVGYYLMGKDSNFKPKKLDVKEKIDSLVEQYFSNRDDDNDVDMDEVEEIDNPDIVN